jgi:topoisomerase IV subunit A
MGQDLFSEQNSKNRSDDDSVRIAEFAEQAYLDYAISVVKGRALPQGADGQKPVQRRILYAMNQLGLSVEAKPVKSARVVGEVLGRYHPHGDSAAYDALVRMAQSFSLRYPLIDGQGNFGSRDGDGAAAMRYTEARLTSYAKLLLDEVDMGTVDFIDNYDGSTREPAMLPARLPMVLLNGASGIAVGMATEIPSHNLKEVAAAAALLIRKPKSTIEDLLSVLPGPDLPGGAQIISSPSDMLEAYRTGRGSLRMRARYEVEELARSQWQLVIHELPQGVSTQQVLEQIEEMTNPKPRFGKKSVSNEQLQLKQAMLAVLDAVRDESGRDAPVRLVIEPRSSRIELNELVNLLLVNTSLETNLSLNMVMVGLDGRPVQKSLLDCLSEWCTYRLETVRRRSAYRLDKVLDRIHVLEGRQLVLLNIDQVIRIIRESDDPKAALIEAFKLSERQADDILEIRLRQLAKLEAIRIEQELRSLRDESRQLESLIKDEQQLRKQVVKEIEADARQYGDARRTLLESSDKASVALRIADEPVTVIVSEKGWVRVRQGHGHEPGQFSFKAGDGLDALYPVMTTDQLFVISTSGRVYALAVNQLPSARGDGSPITTLIELEAGSRVAFVFAAQVGDRVIFASRLGQGFQCLAADLMTRQRAGKQFMHLDANDMLIRPVVDIKSAEQRLLCLSEQGRALCFSLEELRQLKQGGRGVSLMDCDADDPLVAIAAHTPSSVVIEGTARGSKAIRREFSVRELTAYDANRGRKGKLLEPRIKGGLIVSIGSTSTGQVKDSAR